MPTLSLSDPYATNPSSPFGTAATAGGGYSFAYAQGLSLDPSTGKWEADDSDADYTWGEIAAIGAGVVFSVGAALLWLPGLWSGLTKMGTMGGLPSGYSGTVYKLNSGDIQAESGRYYCSRNSDIIDCKGGNDTAYGNSGNDNLSGNTGNDYLDGGSGNDVLYGTTSASTTTLDTDLIIAGPGNDRAYGGGGNDRLYGYAGNDTLYGGDGTDSLYGGDSPDRLYGETGNDIMEGGEGSDFLYGGAGNDSLTGFKGADQLYGGTGNDWLSAGNDGDKLDGGSGNDRMTGGYGNDTFCYGSLASGERDTIFVASGGAGTGFTEADVLDLRAPVTSASQVKLTWVDGDTVNVSALGAIITVNVVGIAKSTFTIGEDVLI